MSFHEKYNKHQGQCRCLLGFQDPLKKQSWSLNLISSELFKTFSISKFSSFCSADAKYSTTIMQIWRCKSWKCWENSCVNTPAYFIRSILLAYKMKIEFKNWLRNCKKKMIQMLTLRNLNNFGRIAHMRKLKLNLAGDSCRKAITLRCILWTFSFHYMQNNFLVCAACSLPQSSRSSNC